ncbi:HNH endonuclease signature motif containing protein [Nostocoides sp. HKS02]|uniref:HNH endonuclease signature motif containing protein n=1 Tax=Nostocoides sp. HKS02 TaxID=1813880 RepID=UPI0018A81B13|nr:HNH endonuclease signature motif containing protein [Tetrasphaera sp. HKS02]
MGALVEQAVREAKDALFLDPAVTAPGDADAADPHSPSYADAFEEVANRSLASVSSSSRAAHYRVYVHLATDGAWVGGRHAIPMPLVQRFLSDGVLQPVWETEGRPVSVGRDLRILPLRSRRLVEDRDRGCRFPGCTTTRFVEIHHLLDWASGGATDVDNLVSLCPFHHDGVTRGDFTMTGDPTRPDGLAVTNRYGVPVGSPRWRDLSPPAGADPPQWGVRAAYEPPSGEAARWRDIEIPPDADLAFAG